MIGIRDPLCWLIRRAAVEVVASGSRDSEFIESTAALQTALPDNRPIIWNTDHRGVIRQLLEKLHK